MLPYIQRVSLHTSLVRYSSRIKRVVVEVGGVIGAGGDAGGEDVIVRTIRLGVLSSYHRPCDNMF